MDKIDFYALFSHWREWYVLTEEAADRVWKRIRANLQKKQKPKAIEERRRLEK